MNETQDGFAGPKELSGLCAGDVMTPDPATVTPETPLSEVMDVMDKRGIRHFPVVDNGRLAGMLSERHLRDAMPSILTVDDPEARKRYLRVTTVAQVARENPPSCTPQAPLTGVIRTLRTFRVGALPVVEGKQIVGIVTSGDLLTVLERVLRAASSW